MPRYTLSQLLMGTAFIAILLVFTRTEGCGTRYAMIETLSFSSNDASILTTKLTARDARTRMKVYKSDVARTISWIDAATGASRGVIHQDFKPGNRGPAAGLWWEGRNSAGCSPSNDRVAIAAFGGGDVTCGLGEANPTVFSLRSRAYNIAISQSGRFLAASGPDDVTVFDTHKNAVAMRVHSSASPFLDSPMSFTADETQLAVASDAGVHVWDIATSARTATVVQGQLWVHAIAFAPDDTLVVCCGSGVRRYDLSGNLIATLDKDERRLCRVSANGNMLAVSGIATLKTYDLESNELGRTIPFDDSTALALSADSERLAVGDYNGCVALIETKTGNRIWYANPRGRDRWPWTMPAALLAGWSYVAWRLFKRPEGSDN